MKIEMTKAGLKELNKKYSDKYIVVYYTAKVNIDDSVILGDKGNQTMYPLRGREQIRIIMIF